MYLNGIMILINDNCSWKPTSRKAQYCSTSRCITTSNLLTQTHTCYPIQTKCSCLFSAVTKFNLSLNKCHTPPTVISQVPLMFYTFRNIPRLALIINCMTQPLFGSNPLYYDLFWMSAHTHNMSGIGLCELVWVIVAQTLNWHSWQPKSNYHHHFIIIS